MIDFAGALEAHHDDGLLVVDDALPAATFASLAREVANGDYKSVHAQRWDKSWRLWDGQPMRGESVYFDPGRAFGWKGATYPTSTSADALIDAVRDAALAHPTLAGAEGRDWIALYLAPWIYPVGSALALHLDAGRYTGSFTFFAHAQWNLHWGGELVVSAPTACDLPVDGRTPWMCDEGAELPGDRGIATSITPRPNRLVLLGPDRPHRIARVDANAGARVRASVAGFFLRAP